MAATSTLRPSKHVAGKRRAARSTVRASLACPPGTEYILAYLGCCAEGVQPSESLQLNAAKAYTDWYAAHGRHPLPHSRDECEQDFALFRQVMKSSC